MRSKWTVTSNFIGGGTMYGVYRIIDPTAVDHSGNREMFGSYVETREEATAIAEKLNSKEKPAQ